MKLQVLYIGSSSTTIRSLENHSDFQVVREENGFSAFKYLTNCKNALPDAIIAEHYIPGLNGVELVKRLHTNGTSNVPYFLIDKDFKKEDVKEFLKLGIADGYTYQLNPEDIKERIIYLKENQNITKKDALQSDYKMPIVKRLFDIVVASFILLIISPFLLLVMLAIRIESRGKVYYTSKRVGTGYRVFDFYKLRSMYTGADAKLKDLKHLNQYSADVERNFEDECPDCKRMGKPCSPILMVDGGEICENLFLKKKRIKNASAFFKIKDDPRITKVGKFIRNTSIDELPQLINVIKGDMSIVGNRPLPLYEAELLTSDQWILRFMAPAGITGLWQTMKRGKGSMSEEERKGLDNKYAFDYSFWNDIKIILKTIPALLQKENV